MDSNDVKEKVLTRRNVLIVLGILLLILVILLFRTCDNKKDINKQDKIIESTIVEDAVKSNVELIKEVKQIDSIKYEKAIEVKQLDNDSTLKLFYELIRK